MHSAGGYKFALRRVGLALSRLSSSALGDVALLLGADFALDGNPESRQVESNWISVL